MAKTDYIKISEFCVRHGIEESFVLSLAEFEVISVTSLGKEQGLAHQELPYLEKMLRIHQDLNVNPEGLQVIHHLLQKVEKLQDELNALQRTLDRLDSF